MRFGVNFYEAESKKCYIIIGKSVFRINSRTFQILIPKYFRFSEPNSSGLKEFSSKQSNTLI